MMDSRESVIEQAAQLASSPKIADFQTDSDLELDMLLLCIVWHWFELTFFNRPFAHFNQKTTGWPSPSPVVGRQNFAPSLRMHIDIGDHAAYHHVKKTMFLNCVKIVGAFLFVVIRGRSE